MFICSFKLNKTGVLSAIAALCLSLTLVFLMLPESTDSTSAPKGTTVQSEEAMVEYLSSIGRTVAPNALLIEEITIPATFFSLLIGIFGSAATAGDLGIIRMLLTILPFAFIPLITGAAYLLGYKDISITEKLIYKNKKDRKK